MDLRPKDPLLPGIAELHTDEEEWPACCHELRNNGQMVN